MPPLTALRTCAVLLLIFLQIPAASAAEFRAAVASNFVDTFRLLAARFEQTSPHKVVIVPGSTGKHFAQISNGAPFDVFFAADTERPRLLENKGRILAGSRFTYARGSLVLWSVKPDYVDGRGEILQSDRFRHLAMANPSLAPYGRAAQQVLEARGLWRSLRSRIVQGENINQAFHFVMSGNAELGFVAFSQITKLPDGKRGSVWRIDPSLYPPIEQQAVLLSNNEAARRFIEFVKGRHGRIIIRQNGYDVP